MNTVMADVETVNQESEEVLLLRHKKERKELLSKVTAIKKACAKGDKKKRKEVAEEIASLEAELDKKQELELQALQNNKVEQIADAVETLELASPPTEQAVEPSEGTRLSKAQRRRDKKAREDKEREIRIAQQAEENKFGPRHLEEVKIKQLLSQRHLALHEVPSDGNCLYFAVAHQLAERGEAASVSSLRELTAAYLREHEEELRPFTSSPQTGEELSSEEFELYCSRVERDSSEWGGQLELQALSEALQRPIEVLQAEGTPVVLGERHHPLPAITLTYHRHAFGLGEHYNSVKKAQD